MNMKKISFSILFLMVTLFLTACSQKESAGSKVTEKAQQTFLMFSESNVAEDGRSIGDLYLKTIDTDEEKIASDVISGSFQYDMNNDKILFIDEENTLYEAEAGQDKVKLASDVLNYNANQDNNIITYQNSEEDLYILDADRESEKIASEIIQFEVVDSNIYYLGYDNDFNVYDIESRQESQIASNVTSFTLLDDNEYVYTNDDYMLFYKKDNEESVKISSKETNSSYIQKVEDKLIYMATDDDVSDLYISSLDGNETSKVASDVNDFEIQGEDIYYLTYDQNLYMKKLDDAKATKLISEINNFTLSGDTIYFSDEENNYYRQVGKDKKEKIASDVYDSVVIDSGEFLYQNADDELFLDKTKIASDIDEFSLFGKSIAYGTIDNKLYLLEIGKEPELIADELDMYSTVTYNGQVIYSNTLSFEEITGYYYYVNGEESIYYEIDEDGYFIDPLTGEKLLMELQYAGFNYIEVMVDDEYGTIRIDGDTLSIEYAEEILELTKTTKDDMDKSIAAYKEELEKQALAEEVEEAKQEIELLISDYLYEYMYAVNWGDTSSMGMYISENSSFYTTQTDYAMSLYEKGTTLDLIDYTVGTPEKTAEYTYKVAVDESFSIYSVDGTSKDASYTSLYEVKNLQGEWYITNMELN